jgi:hypothetical protein
MVVTDYRTKTAADLLSSETANEWRRLAAECGLTTLIEKQDNGEVALAWLKLDNQTKNALKWLCPMSATLDKYNHDIPPIEALGLISYAQMTNEFTKIEIHYNDRLPDPVAIGTKGNEAYLICAWGPEEMPVERWVDKFRAAILAGFDGMKKRAIEAIQLTTADSAILQWLQYGWCNGSIDIRDLR